MIREEKKLQEANEFIAKVLNQIMDLEVELNKLEEQKKLMEGENKQEVPETGRLKQLLLQFKKGFMAGFERGVSYGFFKGAAEN